MVLALRPNFLKRRWNARLRALAGYGAIAVLFNLVIAIGSSGNEALAAEKRLLLLGDSLTAGYGLAPGQGFAPQLERALRGAGHSEVAVINAGVSGDTSAGGLARLDWSLADNPTHAVLELGANDALRGLDPAAMERNLDAIISGLKQAGAQVLLTGMRAPANLGPEYKSAFEGAYERLAEKHEVLLYPFFLDGLVGKRELIQGDGLHPNVDGVAVIVRRILPFVEALLSKASP